MLSFLSLKDYSETSKANRHMHAISLLPQSECFRGQRITFGFADNEKSKVEDKIAEFNRWWSPIARRLPLEVKVPGQGAALELLYVTPHIIKALPLKAIAHAAELELTLDKERDKSLTRDAGFNSRLGAMRNLQRLTVRGPSPDVIDYLYPVVMQLQEPTRAVLAILDLTNLELTALKVETIALALGLLPNLRKLPLSANPGLGADGVAAVINALSPSSKATITSLGLSHVGLTADNAATLAPALALLPNLQELVLSNNRDLGAAGVITLVNALSPLAKARLNILYLFNVGLTMDNAATLEPVLAQLPNLQKLSVSRNPLDAAALTVLASFLGPSAVILHDLGSIEGTRVPTPVTATPASLK
jgi:hypothetical protein